MATTPRKCVTFLPAIALILLALVGTEGYGGSSQCGPFVNSAGVELVLIPEGTFTMGSTRKVPETVRQYGIRPFWCNLEWTNPPHAVTLKRPFLISRFEVTQEQYERVMGTNPSRYRQGHLPVEGVSWNEGVEFCRRLTEKDRAASKLPDHLEYRLPTEGEWEYACRAGNPADDLEDDPARMQQYASCYESGRKICRGGSKRSNAWGVYNMRGNVSEWCSDWFARDYYRQSPLVDPKGPSSGTMRVIRGGGAEFTAKLCLAYLRNCAPPTDRWPGMGLRIVCAAVPDSAKGRDLTSASLAGALNLRWKTSVPPTRPSSPSTASGHSIEPQGTNIAAGAQVEIIPGGPGDTGRIVDGDPSTGWTWDNAVPCEIRVTLRTTTRNCHSLRIHWGEHPPLETSIRRSFSSRSWYHVGGRSSADPAGEPKTRVYSLMNRTIRYIKIYVRRVAPDRRLTLNEVEVFSLTPPTSSGPTAVLVPSTVPGRPSTPLPKPSPPADPGLAACAELLPEFTSLLRQNKPDDAIAAATRFASSKGSSAARREVEKMKKDAERTRRVGQMLASALKKLEGKEHTFDTRHGKHTGVVRKVTDGMAYLEIGKGDGAVHAPIKMSSFNASTVVSLLAGEIDSKSAEDNLALGVYLLYILDEKEAASRQLAIARTRGADTGRYAQALSSKTEPADEKPAVVYSGMPRTPSELETLQAALSNKNQEQVKNLAAIETAYKTNERTEILTRCKDWKDADHKPFSSIAISDLDLASDAARHVSYMCTRVLSEATSGVCPQCGGRGKITVYKSRKVYSTSGGMRTVTTPVQQTCPACHGRGKFSKGRRIAGLTHDEIKKIAQKAETYKRDLYTCRSAARYSSSGSIDSFVENLKSRTYTPNAAKWCWDRGLHGIAAAILRKHPELMKTSGGRP